MPYELTRTRTGDSGERQPAICPPPTFNLLPTISPLPAISLLSAINSLPELTEARSPPSHTTPARAPLTLPVQRASSSYKPTPAPIVPAREAYVPPPRPGRWTVVRRKLGRYLSSDCNTLKNCMSCSQTCCIVIIVIVYLGLQVAHGIWLYYSIDVSLYPNPKRFINSTRVRWRVYEAFLWIFGMLYSTINGFIFGAIGLAALTCEVWPEVKPVAIISAFVLPPICAFFIVVPTFGSIIFITPIRQMAYNHRCDSWAAQVVLDGRGYKDPLSLPSTALFVTAGDSRPLFSFDLDQPQEGWARFYLRKFESPEETIESQYIPALREIVYDFVNLRLNGTCGTNATPCLSGKFELDRLIMDLQFNLTTNSPEVHSRAQSSDRSWSWPDEHPTLNYKTLFDDDSPGDEVLQTTVTRAGDCTRLKTCLAGSRAEGSGGVFGPDVLAPLGILLAKQSQYALSCTKPK